MSNQKIKYIVGDSYNIASIGAVPVGLNAPYGAEGVEVRITDTADNYWQFTPRLQSGLKYTAVGNVWTDGTTSLTERGTTNVLACNSMVASNDFLYFGARVPFRGIYLNISAANGTASVVSAFYRKSDATWAGLTETDGTASGGATLAVDGAITWTVPTDWVPYVLTETSAPPGPPLYWVRMNSDGGTDSATSIAEAVPLSIQTLAAGTAAKGVVAVTTAVTPPRYWFDRQAVGGIEIMGNTANDIFRIEWLCTSHWTGFVAQ